MFRELYVLIEGNDDQRFVELVVKPIIGDRYDYMGYDPTPVYSPAQIRVFSVLLIYSTGLKSPKELCGLNSL